MLVIAGAVIGVLWLSSTTTATVSSRLPSSLLGIELRVQSGDVAIVGGSQTGVSVSREDRSVFGHGPRERRSISSGIVRISSSCPELVIGSCAAGYRVAVPNDIPISIRVEHGSVRLDGYHGSADIATDSGAITVEGYTRTSASTSRNSAPLKLATPAQSTRVASGSRLSRSFKQPPASAGQSPRPGRRDRRRRRPRAASAIDQTKRQRSEDRRSHGLRIVAARGIRSLDCAGGVRRKAELSGPDPLAPGLGGSGS